MKVKVTRTHHEKIKKYYHMDKYKQTNRQAQDNIYQLIPPQGTSDIARGMGLLIN